MIAFRTRGGGRQGWGNVYRLVSLAEYIRSRHREEIEFWVEGPERVTALPAGHGFSAVGLPEDVDVEAEEKLLRRRPRPDMVIMEMLEPTYDRQVMLRRLTARLGVFDDLLDHRYCADLVVAGQQLPAFANREISNRETRFLTGYDYFLCRPEFLEYAGKERSYRSTVKNVLVTFGGGPYDAAYIKAARAISHFPDMKATFVLGGCTSQSVVEAIHDQVPDAECLSGTDCMEQLLWETDFAFVNGGYTKLEAALTGTPAVMIACQWHQIPLAQQYTAVSGMPYAGYMSYVSVTTLIECLEYFKTPGIRRRHAARARGIPDGNGMNRVYDEICSLYTPGHHKEEAGTRV